MSDLPDFLDHHQLDLPRTAEPVDLSTALTACHAPGVSIALIDGGEVTETWCAGVRDIELSEPVRPRTLFQAGSISKSIAAACALRLVADGQLDLDADVNDHLTSWRIPANGGWQPRVTLRQLLAHTAGTTVHGLLGYPVGTPVPSVPDILDGHGNSQPVRVTALPGTQHRYSGGGYTVMQQLLVDATGTDFVTLAHDLVLDPVGMADSTYAQPLPAGLAVSAATGYRPGPAPVIGRWHTYPDMAAAGLWSTATDLARFFVALRDSVRGLPGALLPQPLARQMATRAATNKPYGLGVAVAEDGAPAAIGNNGSDEGFRCYANVFVDSGQGAAVMTNGDYGSDAIAELILPALARHYDWPAAAPDPAPTVSDADLPGRYASAEGDFVIRVVGDTLELHVTDQPPVPLRRGTAGRWCARVLNLDLTFPAAGTVLIHQDETPTLCAHRLSS